MDKNERSITHQTSERVRGAGFGDEIVFTPTDDLGAVWVSLEYDGIAIEVQITTPTLRHEPFEVTIALDEQYVIGRVNIDERLREHRRALYGRE